MKRLIIGFACLWPAIAAAQATQDRAMNTAAAVQVKGTPERISLPPQLYNVWYDEFNAVAGEYRLSNGSGMSLSMWGNRMYVRIGKEAPMQLVAVSPYVFVGRARQVKIVVEEPDRADGNRIHATVLLPSRMLSSHASMEEYTTILAQR